MRPPDWAIRTKADELALDLGCWWDQKKGDALVAFAHNVYRPQYVEGEWRLLDWQERFLRSLVSWRDKAGHRRIKFANLHCPKKQGKTMLCAVLSAFDLLTSTSPLTLTGSVSIENASQIFSDIRHALNVSGLARFCQVTPNQKRIRIAARNAEYRALASDGDRVQGFNASLVVLDEAGWHKSASLYDALKYATISRPDGLVVCISTPGPNPSGYYHGIYQKSKRVLAGEDLDTTWYAEVYESLPEADSEDPAEWYRANPSLGTSFSEQSFGLDLQAAKTSDDRAEWLRFLRYRLARWVVAEADAYYDVELYDRGRAEEPDLSGYECHLAADVSMTTDPSSVVALWHLGDQRYYVKSWAWTSREGVKYRERTSLPRYQQFEAEGWMEITDGDRIDDELILDQVLDLCRDFDVKTCTFDPTSAVVLMGRVEQATSGVDVRRMTQSFTNFNGPMRALNKAIHEGRIQHDGNNWLRYCLQSLRVEENRHGEIRPITKRSVDHIDGAVALLMGYSAAVQHQDGPACGVEWV